MTDLEMVKRCAERFGFEPYEDQSQWKLEAPAIACKLGKWSGECIVYNPLTDDAQAMALVKRFNLSITPDGDCSWWDVEAWGFSSAHINVISAAQNKDLNRAVCECVARMPK
jgi:hypothetical protein